MGRKRFCTGVALFACVLSFGGCFLPEEEEKPSILVKEETVKTYEMTQVERGDIQRTKTLAATYQEVKSENLSFSVDGMRLEGVYVSLGDTVKKGDLLAQLYHDEEREELESLEYELKTQELELTHLQEQREFELEHLLEKKASLSETEYEAKREEITTRYKTSMEDLEDTMYIESLRYEELRAWVDGCCIYAGMDGAVTYVGYAGSSYRSKAGRTMLTVSDSTVCAFQCSDMEYIPYFTVGETYTLATSGGVEYETVLAEADAENGVFRFELKESQYGLSVGLRVLYSLLLDKREDVLYLPKRAVHYVDETAYVYYIDEDGIRQIKYITTGMEGNSYVEILEGLQEGEEVILR